MSDCLEVLFVSDSNGNNQTSSCFDPHIGTTLMSYKGNAASRKCLSVIGNDYLISADSNKPILNVWPLNSQEPSFDLKMITSGKPSTLCVSQDGHYCVAGISGKLYVWQISSGVLLNVISMHYQTINKVVFTDDSSFFISAGEDGLVLVWRLADVVAKQLGNMFQLEAVQVQPFYKFTHHSLPVTDIFVGNGGLKSRLFTVSPDQTCKIYCLSSGTLLLSIVFDYVLTAVTVNEIETELFVGTNRGKIQIFKLNPYPRRLEHHIEEDIEKCGTFNGHADTVTCLHTSFDGITLASGSDDGKVFLWNIPSRQLLRSFEMKGPVTNMFFLNAASNIFANKFKPQLVVNKFERISDPKKDIVVNIRMRQDLKPISMVDEFQEVENLVQEPIIQDANVIVLQNEIDKLKSVNKEMFEFAMNRIIANPLTIGLSNLKA